MLKVVQLVPHGSGDADAVLVSMAQTFLQEAEEAPAARDADGHAAKFSQGFVPKLGGDFVLASELVKDLLESEDAMRGELQGFVDSVNEPAKDDFAGAEVGITFEQLFDGGDMVPVGRVVRVDGPEDSINGM